MLQIPRQIWFWPIAESVYNTQNAQFSNVMKNKFKLVNRQYEYAKLLPNTASILSNLNYLFHQLMFQ